MSPCWKISVIEIITIFSPYFYIYFSNCLNLLWLSNILPIKLAIIAFITSAGIKTNDKVIDFDIGKLVISPITIVPTISSNTTPMIIVVNNNTTKFILLKYKSLTKPIRYVITGYINKKPVDGHANTPIPPRPPDNKGNQVATSNNNTITLR